MGKKKRNPSAQSTGESDEILTVNRSQLKTLVDQIFTELLEEKFNNFMENKFKENFEAKSKEIISSLTTIDGDLQSLSEINKKIESLEKQLMETRITLNHAEQHSRRWAVRIHGLPPPSNPQQENAKRVSSQFFQDKLGLNIPVVEIDCAHRVGNVRNDQQSMIVKVFKRDYIDAIIKHRNKLKNTPYVIHEDATLENRRLLNRLKNHSDIERAWLLRGTVWAISNAGKKFKVDLFDDVAKKIRDA